MSYCPLLHFPAEMSPSLGLCTQRQLIETPLLKKGWKTILKKEVYVRILNSKPRELIELYEEKNKEKMKAIAEKIR